MNDLVDWLSLRASQCRISQTDFELKPIANAQGTNQPTSAHLSNA
jgi:hypothetical protein